MSNFSETDIRLFKLLQQDLPLTSRPYAEIGRNIGLSEEEVIERIKKYKSNGVIRRFGTAVRHRELGIVANAMVVWDVPDERTEIVGRNMSSFPEVSHCYQRPRFAGWQYNMYTMVHGQTKEDCKRIAVRIAEKVDIQNYDLLFSTKELKKTSMKYFME